MDLVLANNQKVKLKIQLNLLPYGIMVNTLINYTYTMC